MRTSEGLSTTPVAVHRERCDIGRSHDRLNHILIPLVVLVAVIYLATAGVPRLFDQIDGQYAGAAREMIAGGDWLTPTQDGIPRLQKPPLVYWCEILSLRLFGQNEFAARFPVALTTVAWLIVTAALVERLSGRRVSGVCAALILATFAGTYFFTHLVMPEPFSALFLICTLYGLVGALQSEPGPPREQWLLLAWLFISLGTLTKGLHALLIPLAIGAASYTYKRSTREAWRRFFLRPHGWILFCALVTPWYIVMEWRYPGFVADQLGNEQLGNLFNQRWPVDSDRVPVPQFFLEHAGLLFPWSLFLPGAVLTLWRSRKSWLSGEWHVLLFFLIINVLGILFAKIQDYYLLISWPVLAIGLAWFFVSGRGLSRRLSSIPGWLLLALGIAGLCTATCLIWRPIGTSKLVDIVADARTVSGGLGGILSEQVSGLTPLLLIASCVLILAGAAITYFARQTDSLAIVSTGTALMIVLFLTSNYALHLVEDQFSSARVASKIEQLGGANYEVVCEFEANDLTSLFFYLPHSIQWLNANPEMEFATRNLDIGRGLYLSEERFRKLWDGGPRTFLITDQGRLPYWRRLLQLDDQHGTPVAIVGTKMILMNH